MENATFTEHEVKKFEDFLNLISQKAKWDVTTREAFDLSGLYSHAVQLSKKCRSLIFEIEKVTPPPKARKEKNAGRRSK